MITVINDNAKLFGGKNAIHTGEQELAIDAIAHAIAHRKAMVISLLNKYGIVTTAQPTNQELLNGLLTGFNNFPDMHKEFAFLMMGPRKFSNLDDGSEADAGGGSYASQLGEDWGGGSSSSSSTSSGNWFTNLFSGGGSSNYTPPASSTTQQPPSSGGGSGWLGAVSGIVSGVGGILSLFQQPNTTAQAQATNAQILALAAQKEAARRRNNIIAVSATIVGSALIIFIIYKIAKPKK